MQNSKELQLGPPVSSRGAWESLEVLPLPVAQIPCKMLVVRGPCLGECVSKITIWPIWGIYVKILAKRGTVLTRNRRKLLPRPDEKIIRLPETMFFFGRLANTRSLARQNTSSDSPTPSLFFKVLPVVLS